ncbi:hypothetical protein D3C85_1421750 [compost metagenome]
MTAVRATAPPGGCRLRVRNMAAMASITARAEASAMSGTRLALTTPIRADTPLPTRMDQG